MYKLPNKNSLSIETVVLFLAESTTRCIKMIMCAVLTRKFEIYATNRLTIAEPPFHLLKNPKTKAEGIEGDELLIDEVARARVPAQINAEQSTKKLFHFFS